MNRLASAAQPLFLVLVLLTMAGGVAVLLREPSGCLTAPASGREASTSSREARASTQVAQRPSVRNGTGSLAQVVRQFVAAQPGRDSQAYEPPQPDEVRAMRSGFELLARGQHAQAAEVVAPLEYEVVRCNDPQRGTAFALLAERRRPDGSWPHGWGLYVHDETDAADLVAAPAPLVVEVPHPSADLESAAFGVDLFQLAEARFLLVAGAHRYAVAGGAADVAHRTDSVFEALHRAVLRPNAVVVQPHGFAEIAHPGLGEVVISAGVAPPPPLVSQIASALNFVAPTCVYDGVSCRALAGTRNVQGQSARAGSAQFIHLELSFGIRSDAGRREEVARQLADVLRT